MKDYLILTTVGKSKHWKNWLQENRNYDIALVYYENDSNYKEIQKEADYFWHRQGFKYTILKNIMNENKDLLKYKYIWMPDDDIVIRKGTINQLFEWAEKLDLNLAQPSIIPKNVTWPVTIRKKNSSYRYISMVEIMCPMFKGEVLEKVYHTFDESHSGWGLEWAWVKLTGEPPKKIAINDLVVAEHLKSIKLNGGRLYEKLRKEKGLTPHQELKRMIAKYPIKNKHFTELR